MKELINNNLDVFVFILFILPIVCVAMGIFISDSIKLIKILKNASNKTNTGDKGGVQTTSKEVLPR